MYITRPPPPYFIVLASSVKIIEIKAVEFHIIGETRADDKKRERATGQQSQDNRDQTVAGQKITK